MTFDLSSQRDRRMPTVRLLRQGRLPVLAAVVCMLLAPAARAEEKLAEIDGGADESRHNYQWVVVNLHTSPIVYIEFPHYHADTFTVPPRWKAESTFLVNVGVEDRPGVCIARPEPPNPGIARGGAQRFEMRIAGAAAPVVGRGKVKIRFADGKETVVTNVSLPEPPAPNFRYLPLMGAAMIFGVWVVVRTIRDRRRRERAQAPETSPLPGGQKDAN
jgi:hypothetical protein